MATKICYQCRSEVDLLAKVCAHCRAKLGGIDGRGVAKKPTSLAVGCIAVFIGIGVIGGIAGTAMSSNKPAPVAKQAEPVDPKYGPMPDIMVMTYALTSQIKAGLHDPDSLQGPELADPVKDTITLKGKKVDCWKIRLQFRAKNGFGALRRSTGTIWMKDGASVREVMDQ